MRYILVAQETQSFKYISERKGVNVYRASEHFKICDMEFQALHILSVSLIAEEGNDLFNNALNTFYLWLFGVRHMVKDTQIVREET